MKSLAFFWELYLQSWAIPGTSEDAFVRGKETGSTMGSEPSGCKTLGGSKLTCKMRGLHFPRLMDKTVWKL